MNRRQIFLLFFLLVVFLVLGAMHYMLWAHLVRATALPGPLASLVVVAYLGLVGSLLAARIFVRDAGRYLAWPGYILLGFMALLFVCTSLVYPVRLLVLAGFHIAGSPLDVDQTILLCRILAGAATLAATSLSLYGLRTALAGPRLVEIEVPLARLPRACDGYAIVQISDVHFGGTVGRGFAEQIVRTASAGAPDLIAITGDLVDGPVRQLRDVVAPLGALRARDGVWFITGNHEYYAHADPWIAHLGGMGIRTLRNEHVAIGDSDAGFDLAGVDDWEAGGHGHGHDLARALAGRDPTRALVLLAHQPRTIFEASRSGVDLQLSGHTHGGQIWPWNFLVRLQQPYIAGLYRHGETYLYVSRGTGYWGPPMRVGARPEIVRIVLRSAPG